MQRVCAAWRLRGPLWKTGFAVTAKARERWAARAGLRLMLLLPPLLLGPASTATQRAGAP